MDDGGRGTSTFDGLARAWASAVYIAQRLNALTLFATHYFELTTLPELLDNIGNVHLDATEHQQGIVFMHTVKPGPANQSYGLQVAQLAGIPADVITSARAKLQELEHQVLPAAPAPQPLHSLQTAQAAQPAQKPGSTKPAQNDLFASTPHPALDRLLQLDPDELNPRQALEWLYEIKKML
jgi:DNA mismatch repair protein MutS